MRAHATSVQRGASFDPHGQSFLTFRRNQWKLWNAAEAAVEASHSDTVEQYTALCWGAVESSGGGSSSSTEVVEGKLVMVFGCASGRLQIWDVRSCEYVTGSDGLRSVAGNSGASVGCLALLRSRSSVLCASAEVPEVVEVRLHDGGVQDHWECDRSGVLGMCTDFRQSSALLCTAGPKKLRLWDFSRRGSELGGPILCAKLTAPSALAGAGQGTSLELCSQGPPLLLCCDGSQVVSVWYETLKGADGKLQREKKACPADILLSSHERIQAAHISRPPKVSGQPASHKIVVVGVTTAGIVVWNFTPGSCKRSVAPSQTLGAEAFNGSVLCARLVSPLEAFVASGPHAVPTFSKVELLENTQPVVTAVGTRKQNRKTVEPKASVAPPKQKVVVGPLEVKASMPHTQKRSSPSDAIAMEGKRPKVQDTPADLTTASSSSSRQTGLSLSPVVRQALRAKDSQRMEVALRTADKRVISSTVSELTGAEAYDLIMECGIRLTSQPVRGQVLSEWIKHAMLEHAAYISSQPKLKRGIEPIYEALKRRITTHDALLRVQGRLEILVCSGRAILASVKQKRATAEVPLLSYQEGDEDVPIDDLEDDDAGDGMEDDEDELSDLDFLDDDSESL
eukprot:gnl/MRDRNA2_/MRDRNA2_149333_c0_seq1.p1 gnl/MRDRNA2_/MRDRNA2_149333_c0~~gnl/MRDRNA2_/MRDRNA2_149333_c0_seq1.p1  ORF type:complete len:624 (+),score=112.33 gnl/MRDRNA2_/MRDRNA2_149333_c0_seq1:63-1934(+)